MSALTPWKAHALLSELSTPIISAPMANVAGSLLAGTIARAGGLGFIGAGMMEKDNLRRCHYTCDLLAVELCTNGHAFEMLQ